MTKKKHCIACKEVFNWNDDVVIVGDDLFHKDCLSLYPTGYFAFLDGDPIGETENEDGQSAFEILDEGEYEED